MALLAVWTHSPPPVSRAPHPSATPPASHTTHCPTDGLDFQEMGWGWGSSFSPGPSDFEASALLQQLIADFAANRGVMPASYGWAPVTPGQPVATLVFAQDSGWPGGGVRAYDSWKARQCAVLEAHMQPLQNWWWCD